MDERVEFYLNELRNEVDVDYRGGVKLKSILSWAIKNSAFYADIPKAQIECFPVVNKNIMRNHSNEILVKSFENQKTHISVTSGSTGTPFTVVQNMDKRKRHIADLKYFGEKAGYQDGMSLCYLRAMSHVPKEQQERENFWQLEIMNLSDEMLDRHYKTIIEKDGVALMGYASTLNIAVTYWMKAYPENKTKIRTVISTSEALPDSTREKLEMYFGKDCKVCARYSDNEMGILGQEDFDKGQYVLNWGSYYFEILKMDSDERAEDGELGRIVITDLYNKAFPMIRYDTGDIGKMSQNGNGFPVLTELYGRRMDLIYDTKGNIIPPALVYRIMRFSKNILQWQFIQNNVKQYTLKIVPETIDTKPNMDEQYANFLKAFGSDADFKIEYTNDIPVLNSQKRKLIVSLIEKEGCDM